MQQKTNADLELLVASTCHRFEKRLVCLPIGNRLTIRGCEFYYDSEGGSLRCQLGVCTFTPAIQPIANAHLEWLTVTDGVTALEFARGDIDRRLHRIYKAKQRKE